MAYVTSGAMFKNFSLSEMTNKQAKDEIKLVLTPEVVEFAEMMQELRDWYGKPMTVSSWYRTKSFNASLKGSSPVSAHLDGRACDIANIPKDRFDDFIIAWQVICSIHNKVGGVNLYSWGLHFTDYEDKFGNKVFQIRDKR